MNKVFLRNAMLRVLGYDPEELLGDVGVYDFMSYSIANDLVYFNTAVNQWVFGGSTAVGSSLVEVQGELYAESLVINDYTMPTADGNADDIMVTDGAGNVTFTSPLEKIPHSGMSDMPDTAGTNTDHDNRYAQRTFLNGTFKETFNALATSDGATVTLTVTNASGGDLTMQFSDFDSTFTGGSTIALTAGSDTSPQANYIYIPQSTKVLTKSTTGFPTSAEHIKIGYFLVPSAGFVQTSGVYINQNWNDHLSGTDSQGHLTHLVERSRRDGAYYFSGIDGNGTDGYLTPTAGNVELKATSGVIYQMHRHAVPAFDTSGTDMALVKNWSGDPYHAITNLYDITADSTGATISNNKYFNLVIWAVGNKGGEFTPMMINLPSGSYNTQAGAEADTNGFDDFSMPRDFNLDSSTGFLIARITVQMKTGGGTWVVASTTDLRGQTPSTAIGGAAGVTTEFADNTFTIFDNTDNTKVIAFDVGTNVTTATTRTYKAPDLDGTLALLELAQDFTATQSISVTSTEAFLVRNAGDTEDVLIVDTLNERVIVGSSSGQDDTFEAWDTAVDASDPLYVFGYDQSASLGVIASGPLDTTNDVFRFNGTTLLVMPDNTTRGTWNASGLGILDGVATTNYALDIERNANSLQGILYTNTDSGANSQTRIGLASDTASAVVSAYSSGWAAPFTNRSVFLSGASGAGVMIMAQGTGQDIELYTGSTGSGSLRATFADTTFTLDDPYDIVLGTSTGTKIGTATNQKLGFYNATPIVQPSAYTQTYATADKTHAAYTPDDESSAYTGIDNAQAGTVYAQVSDLNALRTAYENLRASHEDTKAIVNSLIDDLQAIGLIA